MFYTVFLIPNYNYYAKECFNNQNYTQRSREVIKIQLDLQAKLL